MHQINWNGASARSRQAWRCGQSDGDLEKAAGPDKVVSKVWPQRIATPGGAANVLAPFAHGFDDFLHRQNFLQTKNDVEVTGANDYEPTKNSDIIIITAYASVESAIAAMQAAADDLVAEDDYAEYRDDAFLQRLGVTLVKRSLSTFWPNGSLSSSPGSDRT
jgi:hypothetical protein